LIEEQSTEPTKAVAQSYVNITGCVTLGYDTLTAFTIRPELPVQKLVMFVDHRSQQAYYTQNSV